MQKEDSGRDRAIRFLSVGGGVRRNILAAWSMEETGRPWRKLWCSCKCHHLSPTRKDLMTLGLLSPRAAQLLLCSQLFLVLSIWLLQMEKNHADRMLERQDSWEGAELGLKISEEPRDLGWQCLGKVPGPEEWGGLLSRLLPSGAPDW